MKTPKILAISGSTKRTSTSYRLLENIFHDWSDQAEITLYKGIEFLPHFNPDLDQEHPPNEVMEFRKAIENADGLLICTPEYVFSLPGSLKNALEWLVSTVLLENKPVARIVAAASGEKAAESLDLILSTIQANVSAETGLLIKGAKGKIDQNGEIPDKEIKSNIEQLMEKFILSLRNILSR